MRLLGPTNDKPTEVAQQDSRTGLEFVVRISYAGDGNLCQKGGIPHGDQLFKIIFHSKYMRQVR